MTAEEYVQRVLHLTAMNTHDMCDGVLLWRTDGAYAPVTFLVMCSDVFAWGAADCEPLTAENLPEFERAIEDCHAAMGSAMYGPDLFACRQRGMRPQGAAYPGDARLWPLFDACGPVRELDISNPRANPTVVTP